MSRGAIAPALAVSGERRRSTGAFCSRSPRHAGCGRYVSYTRARTGWRALSFSSRPWCDVPAVASNAKPAPRVTQRNRAGASGLWGGGAALALSARARRVALVAVFPYPIKEHRTGWRLSPSVRARVATCQLWSPTPSQRRVSHGSVAPALAVSGDEAQHSSALELAARARRAALVVVGSYSIKGRCAGERSLFFGARSWCDVPALASNAKPAPCVTCHAALSRLRSLSLGRGRSTRAFCARAPCRVGCGRFILRRMILCRRKATLFRRSLIVRRARCGLQRQASAACRVAQSRLRSLCQDRRRSMQACCARAPCGAGRNQP